MRRKSITVLLILILTTILGCSSSANELTKAKNEIKKYMSAAQIPRINGLDVKDIMIYVGENNAETLQLQNSVIISYTDNKGKKEPIAAADSNVSIIYGPYVGDKIMTITISNREVEFANHMETTTLNGLELIYTKINNQLMIYTRHNGHSFTSEGRLTDKYTEEKQFQMFADAIQQL